MKKYLQATAALATMMMASAGVASTLSCQGRSEDGRDVVFREVTGKNVRVSIAVSKDGQPDYRNHWTGDQSESRQKVNGVVLSASFGSYAEYYFKLDLTGSGEDRVGDLIYQENDSGWEYAVEVPGIRCQLK